MRTWSSTRLTYRFAQRRQLVRRAPLFTDRASMGSVRSSRRSSACVSGTITMRTLRQRARSMAATLRARADLLSCAATCRCDRRQCEIRGPALAARKRLCVSSVCHRAANIVAGPTLGSIAEVCDAIRAAIGILANHTSGRPCRDTRAKRSSTFSRSCGQPTAPARHPRDSQRGARDVPDRRPHDGGAPHRRRSQHVRREAQPHLDARSS